MALTTPIPLQLYQAAVLAFAAGLGLLAGLQAHYVVAVAVGVAFLAFTLSELTVRLASSRSSSFSRALPGREQQFFSAHPVATAGITLLALWLGLSVIWAKDSGAAIATLQWVLPPGVRMLWFLAAARAPYLCSAPSHAGRCSDSSWLCSRPPRRRHRARRDRDAGQRNVLRGGAGGVA